MRKFLRLSAILVAMLAAATMGCDSDSTSGGGGGSAGGVGGGPGDSGGGDVGTDTVTPEPDTKADTPDEPDMGEPDKGPDIPPDPCDPNPCQNPPAPHCKDDGSATVVTYAQGAGTCDAGACTYAVDAETPCPMDTPTCAEGACYPETTEYIFSDAATFMTSLGIGGASGLDDCCFDFDGDGGMDNALGNLVSSLGPILGDSGNVNQLINDAIADGSLIILMEYVDLDSDTDDADMKMFGFIGEDSDDDLTNNMSGSADFYAKVESFLTGTFIPQIAFDTGTEISGGVLLAGPALFKLVIPLGDILLKLDISQTRIEGPVAYGANGTGLNINTGMIGGLVKMEDVFKALNDYFAENCTCLGLDGPLVTYIDENTKAKCAPKPENTCNTDPDTEICDTIAGFCGLAIGFLKADIDSDGTGVADAMSLGAWLDGVSANIIGIEPL